MPPGGLSCHLFYAVIPSCIKKPTPESSPPPGLSSEVLGGQGPCVPGGSSGLQKQGGAAVLVRAGHGSSCLGPRPGDPNIGDRQAPSTWRCQPWRRYVIGARGTRPVLAGMSTVVQGTARGPLVAMAASSRGTAWCNGRHGGHRAQRPTGLACGAIRRARAPDDGRECDHARRPEAARGHPGASGARREPCRRR